MGPNSSWGCSRDGHQKNLGGGDTHNAAKVGAISEDSDENVVPLSPSGTLATEPCAQTMARHLAFSLQEGEVDCWPLTCPHLSCEYTALLEGECCPRCVSDPCLADNITFDIRKTCLDSSGVSRLSGSVWTMAGSPCTTCKCKVIGCPEDGRAWNRCQGTPRGPGPEISE